VIPVILLILGVLVSIFQGIATPSESGAVGVAGALLLAVLAYYFDKILVRAGAKHVTPRWRLTPKALREAAKSTANISILVMTLLFASSFFSLMFLRLGGSDATADFLASIGGGKTGFVIVAMIAVFLLGINLEFLEITFIVVPIFLPAMDLLAFTQVE
jgi:TRAP-type mannitol/chloroaromatic compound transport system permease large subunit